jgi:hypothetical protein
MKGRERLIEVLQEDGNEGAAIAIAQRDDWNPGADVHTAPRKVLALGFCWADSEEGHQYWRDVSDSL